MGFSALRTPGLLWDSVPYDLAKSVLKVADRVVVFAVQTLYIHCLDTFPLLKSLFKSSKVHLFVQKFIRSNNSFFYSILPIPWHGASVKRASRAGLGVEKSEEVLSPRLQKEEKG
jgi:hypothetical protein